MSFFSCGQIASICAASVRIIDSSAICRPWGFRFVVAFMAAIYPCRERSFNSRILETRKEKAPLEAGLQMGLNGRSSGRHQASQFLDRVRFDLADAFGRNTVLAREIVQR